MDAMSPLVTEVRDEPGIAQQISGILQDEIARGALANIAPAAAENDLYHSLLETTDAGKSRALLIFPVRSQDHRQARTPGDVARGQE
jgi:hypothetical protein